MAKQGKGPKLLSTQFVTSFISTSLVLILLGTIALFVMTARNLSNYVKENINVSVLLSDTLTETQINNMKSVIETGNYVREIEYISKEQALKEQIEGLGADPREFLGGVNPFTASFEIKLNSDFANNESLDQIDTILRSKDGVVDVMYQKDLIELVNQNIRKLSMILLVIAALFTYISFALINNTVRLTIFSKRFLINTMKLVGASWGFIRRPFLRQGLLLGIMSTVVADGVLYGGLMWLRQFEPEIDLVIDLEVMVVTGALVLLFGLIITFLCTYFSLEKYLRLRGNELYNL